MNLMKFSNLKKILRPFIFLFIFFVLLFGLRFAIYYDDGTVEAFNGLGENRLKEFIERASKGDTVAAYVLTVHYDSQNNVNKQSAANWAWYGLLFDTSSLRPDKLKSMTSILASSNYPCPNRTQKELNVFFKHWKLQQTTTEVKNDIEEFRKKCSKEQ